MQKVSSFCDYFVICSGSSARQTKAISDAIKDTLRKEGISPVHAEGEQEASWILIDYGDIVAHIFLKDTRAFYNLEWLWSDATKLKLKAT